MIKRYRIDFTIAKEGDPLAIPTLVEDPYGPYDPKEAYKKYWEEYNNCQHEINRLIYQLEMVRDSLAIASRQTKNLKI